MRQMNYNELMEATPLHVYPFKPDPRVLFAMRASEGTVEALQRAEQFVQTIQGELFVLSVLPAPGGDRVSAPNGSEASQSLHAARGAFYMIRAVCRDYLRDEVAEDNIIVRQGHFLAAVAEVALMYNVDLIVLPPSEGKDGRRVTKLTQLTHVPVLIARPPGHTETIVAASDLEDQECPILKRANHLSQQLSAPMVLVHNLQPTVHLAEPTPLARSYDEEREAREQYVKKTSEALAPGADTVLLSSLSTADAILQVANEKRADLIVVGAYRRGWMARLLTSGVAAQVAERASNSVLVTPLD